MIFRKFIDVNIFKKMCLFINRYYGVFFMRNIDLYLKIYVG